MKAYCWLTESHAGLLEEFLLPSLPEGMPISVVVGDQDCPSGEFMKEGWRESMKARCKWWAEIVANEKEPFLLLDADVQFFKDPREDLSSRLQDFELVGQYDVYTPICWQCVRQGQRASYLFTSGNSLKVLQMTRLPLTATLMGWTGQACRKPTGQ